MASLAEIRAKLQAQETRSNGNSNSYGDNAIYPHWNINEGETATIRFLPDSNPNNTFFWVERAMIRLPFAGIVGDNETKTTVVQVPCMEMWGPTGSCPILAEVRPWFKDSSLEDMGRKYWKKKSYLFQGFVRDVAMHVAASSPEYLTPSDVPADVVEKEKQVQIEIAMNEGKPAEIAEKMVVGRMKKFTGEISLTGQAFIMEPKKTVGAILKEKGLTISSFVRLEVGEGIEKKEEDFAAEVEAQIAAAKA